MQAAVRVALGLLAAVALPACARAQTAAAPRLALVIAEAAYPQAPLPTAAADAGLMATAFAQAGFEVTAFLDADAGQLRRAIADFATKARAAGPGIALAVYVTGDGLQYAGENRLVPAGARIERDDEVPGATLRLAELTGPLEAVPAATRLFFFDLSRETPFARKGPALAGGLALVDAPVGSVYAFDTAPGAVAPSDVPPYGAYARALAEAMQAPGSSLGEVLRRVRLRVGELTDGAAVPFDDGAADAGFTFFPGLAPAPTPLSAPASFAPTESYSTAVARDTLPAYVEFLTAFPHDPLGTRVRVMAATRREALIWQEAVRANTPRAYWTYMRRYPRGPHFGDVRRQLFALHAALEPPPRFDIVAFEGLLPPLPDEVAALERPLLTFAAADGPSIPAPAPTLLPAPRSGFFETLPPPPIAPAGTLAPSLPVPTPGAPGRLPGAIAQPAAPGGALVSTLGDGLLTTTKTGGMVVSRLSVSVAHGVRTVREDNGTGALIAKVTMATGADGALTVVQSGPGDVVLSRSRSREALGGGRATTLFDGAGRPLATTLVSLTDIVTASAMIAGRPAAPHFVLAPEPDAKGLPIVVADTEGKPRTSTLPSSAPQKAAKEEGKEAKAAVPPPTAAGAGVAKAPAMPAAAGLTGQAPSLNIPPPPAPAFDAAAAPVATPTAASPTPAVAVAVVPPAAAVVPPPAAVAPPPPAAVAAPPVAPTSQSAAKTAYATRLPSDPPLPPARPVEAKGKRRAGR